MKLLTLTVFFISFYFFQVYNPEVLGSFDPLRSFFLQLLSVSTFYIAITIIPKAFDPDQYISSKFSFLSFISIVGSFSFMFIDRQWDNLKNLNQKELEFLELGTCFILTLIITRLVSWYSSYNESKKI